MDCDKFVGVVYVFVGLQCSIFGHAEEKFAGTVLPSFKNN
jgi:hypothetical protein